MNQPAKRLILSAPGGKQILRLLRRWQGLRSTLQVSFVRPVPTLLLVTGANSPYAGSLLQLLESIARYETQPKTIVYDLGLRAPELDEIARRFPFADLRRFPFERHPPLLDIRLHAGEYAWKPIIIADILHESREPLCWMDASNLLTASTRRLRQVIAARGFYFRCRPAPSGIGLIRPLFGIWKPTLDCSASGT